MPQQFSKGADVYFAQKQRNRRTRKRFVAIALIIVVLYGLAIGGLWVVFRSPLFRIKAIRVQGNSFVPEQTVVSGVVGALKEDQSYHWFWLYSMVSWPRHFSTDQLVLLPEVTNVVVEKKWYTHEIILHVSERTPVGIWCRQAEISHCFWFDTDGILFQRAFNSEGSLIPVIHDATGIGIGIGTSVLPEKWREHFFSILNVIAKEHVALKEITITDPGLEEMHVATYHGPTMLFSLRFPAFSTREALRTLKQNPGLPSLTQIDFRVENRVYYK